jgi:hypothetical protein
MIDRYREKIVSVLDCFLTSNPSNGKGLDVGVTVVGDGDTRSDGVGVAWGSFERAFTLNMSHRRKRGGPEATLAVTFTVSGFEFIGECDQTDKEREREREREKEAKWNRSTDVKDDERFDVAGNEINRDE